MTTESHDTLTKAEAGVEENIDIIDDMKYRSRFLINDHKILINQDPLDRPDFSDLTKLIAHPRMPRLGILDSSWYPLITDDMLKSIDYQFTNSYEADKQNLLRGDTIFPTKEILDKAYKEAIIVLYGMDDNYAKCAIIINIFEDPEYNNGSGGMRRFLVPRY